MNNGTKLIILFILFNILAACTQANYRLPGYEHGTVVCVYGGIMVVVDDDHFSDKEVPELIKKGGEFCTTKKE